MPADNHAGNKTGGLVSGPPSEATQPVNPVNVGPSSQVENDRNLPGADGIFKFATEMPSGFLRNIPTVNMDDSTNDRVVDLDIERYGDIWDSTASYRVVPGKGIDTDNDGDI